jgi:cardiolipin synthase
MFYSTLREKYNDLVLKIKTHPFYFCLGAIFLICFLFFVYTHPLDTEYSRKVRAVLPMVATPAGTLTLTTLPDQGTAPVLDLIKNSSKSIDLVMYEFKDKEIADALIGASKRGVAVRVLINQGYQGKVEKINEPAYAYLSSQGVPVHWAPNYFNLTHQKTLIVDKNKAFIMTFNFTPQYYETSRDFGILDKDQNDINSIENTFNADWSDQKIRTSYGDDLVWSPGSDQDMLLIIGSAKKELDIYNEEMDDNRIINALLEAVKHGVSVNIIMTYQTSWKGAFQELKDAGVNLHLFHGEKGLYIHAKMILIDQTYAFLGSENFSYGSLDQNRELGIFLSDKAIINSLVSTFNADWQNAKAF